MEALNLPESITVRFKASAQGSPESRQEIRDALAKACEGHPVTVIEGFTEVEPYPKRHHPVARKKSTRRGASRIRKTPPLIKDEVLAQVGGQEALAGLLGLSPLTVRNWLFHVPERHELLTRELLRNWKKISAAMPLFAAGQSPVMVSRAVGVPLEELLSVCQRFNVSTTKK